MTLDIDIDADAEWDSSSGAKAIDWATLARSAAVAAIAESAFPQLGQGERTVELSVRLTGDDEVHALNSEWRGRDKPTNVLSFPMAEEPENAPMLGDIVLAHGVCTREALEKHVPVETHATHLVVHGTLHLLGYDHETGDADAEAMEEIERKALASLGMADPYRITEVDS